MELRVLANKILLPTIVILSCAGNLCVILVYSRRRNRKSVVALEITALATTEMAYLCCVTGVFVLPTHVIEVGYIIPLLYGLLQTFRTNAAWTSVFIMFDRFYALRHPLRHQLKFTPSHVSIGLLCCALGSLAYNITRFFELTPFAFVYDENGTIIDYVAVNASALRRNETYITIYHVWLNLLIMYALPFTFLVSIDAYIVVLLRRRFLMPAKSEHGIRAILTVVKRKTTNSPNERLLELKRSIKFSKAARIFRQETSQERRLQRHSSQRCGNSNDHISVTFMLLAEAIAFLLCNSMSVTLNLIENFHKELFDSVFFNSLNDLNNIFSVSNAFLRLPLYLLFGSRFRAQFRSVFCTRASRRPNNDDLSVVVPVDGIQYVVCSRFVYVGT